MTPDKVEAALAVLRSVANARKWWLTDWTDGGGNDSPKSALSNFTEASNGIDEALSVLTEALAERGWRPIESAPRDGTYVLLTDNRCNPCHLIARWKFDRWWGQATPSGKSIIWTDATHWRPLPEPPHDR